MKKLIVYAVALMLGAASFSDVHAQPGRKGHGRWNKKEHAKYRHARQKATYEYARERDKAAYEYRRERDKAYLAYYRERDKEYRAYIKKRNKRYRDHDAWYYGPRFYHRSEYVYFPAYRTYYDPYRRGYVYWHDRAWVFAPTMPSFLVGLNLGAVNVQFMANLPM